MAWSSVLRFAVAALVLTPSLAQDKFEVDIPAEEQAALATIVEDIPPPEDNTTPVFAPAPPPVEPPVVAPEPVLPAPVLRKRKDWESPPYNLIYRNALPIPPVKQPRLKTTNPITGNPIWYYEVEIKPFQQRIYPNLKPANLVGYDGISPGPTFIVPRGTETVVRILNNAQIETSVHLHGSPSRAPFDGWAEDVSFPGQMKDYYFPNQQSARMLWYHDHAMHVTAENAHFGQAGSYIITDASEDALGLPSSYGQFDIPLVLTSKYYNEDGTLQTSYGEDDSLWGDIIHVNGQPWPFLNVQPRKYRFRFLNAALSRSFALYFVRSNALSNRLPFQVIASDAGLLERPVQTTDMYLSNGERYEVVFDFSGHAGQNIEIRNQPEAGGIGTDDDYSNTDKIIRFVVSSNAVTDPSRVPSTLRKVPFPPSSSTIDHHFRFHRTNSEWRINGVGFADVQNRVLAKVPQGTVEIWELENSSGGWTHPIHVHLVDFKVLERRDGPRGVMPYESAGLKDVVWLGRGETVLMEAHYAPWNGLYMFHCHNLIHEDQDMMAAFNVTAIENLGYDQTTDFSDPMDPRWRAVPYSKGDFTGRSGPFTEQAIRAAIDRLARQQPYSEQQQVEQALDAYWDANGAGNPNAPRAVAASEQARPIPRYRRFKV